MNIKQIVKELWEAGRSDLWTEDDTYDWSVEFVTLVMKAVKIKIREDYYHDISFMVDLIGSINQKVSNELEGCLEGIYYFRETDERADMLKLKKRTTKRLTSLLKREFVSTFKYLNANKARLEKAIPLIIEEKRCSDKYHEIFQSKWYKNATKRNYKPKSLIFLMSLANRQLKEMSEKIENI